MPCMAIWPSLALWWPKDPLTLKSADCIHVFEAWPGSLPAAVCNRRLHEADCDHPKLVHEPNCSVDLVGCALEGLVQPIEQARIGIGKFRHPGSCPRAGLEIGDLRVRPHRVHASRIERDRIACIGESCRGL